MSIETPNQSSNNKIDQSVPSLEQLRDIHHAAPIEDEEGETAEQQERKVPFSERYLKTRGQKVGALVLGAAVALGAPTAAVLTIENNVAHDNGSANDKPDTDQSTPIASANPLSSPSNIAPLETAAPTQEAGQTASPLEISAKLSPEQQAKTLIEDRLGKWEMAGATPENQDKWISATDSLAYLNELASENSKSYTQALFIPDWESHEDLSNYVHGTESDNASVVEDFFKTYKSYNTQDKEPYTQSTSVEKTEVVNQTTDSITLSIHATEHNNAAKNRVATLDPGTLKINGNRIIYTVTLKTIDGVQKIAGLKAVKDPTQ